MSKGEEKIYIGCSNFTFSKAHTHSLETSWFHEQISPFMGKYWHDTTLKTQAFRVERRKKNMTLESWCSPPSAAIRKILRVSAGSDSINRVIKAKVEGFSFSTTKKNPSSNHIIFITCPFDELLLSLQNSKKFAKYMMSFFEEFFGKAHL